MENFGFCVVFNQKQLIFDLFLFKIVVIRLHFSQHCKFWLETTNFGLCLKNSCQIT